MRFFYILTLSVLGLSVSLFGKEIGNAKPILNIISMSLPDTCDLNLGSINITVSGGALPYSFEWSNGASAEDINNIPVGSYTVTVTDNNGETSTHSASVAAASIPITMILSPTYNTACDPLFNGAIHMSLTPDLPGTTYLWSNGATTQNVLDLAPGWYNVTVTMGSCSLESTAFVKNHSHDVPITSAIAIKASCGLDNGSAIAIASGGIPPYTYLWSTGETTEQLNNLSVGAYSLTVTAANGCHGYSECEVENVNPPIGEITAQIQPINSCVDPHTNIEVHILPPDPNYTYSWSSGETTQSLTEVSAGSYTLTVSAGGECTASAVFTVPEMVMPGINYTVIDAICGQSNGSLQINGVGGTNPFTYDWEHIPGTDNPQNLLNILPGVYSVTATSAVGCTAEAIFTVGNSNSFSLTATAAVNTSCAVPNGSIDLGVSIPGSYNYSWSNGASAQDLLNLNSGIYTVTTTNANGCSASLSVTVGSNTPSMIVTAVSSPSFSCSSPNGSLDISVSPAGNYTFNWSNAATTQDLFNVPPGAYSVTVMDEFGCFAVGVDTVLNQSFIPQLQTMSIPNTACLAPTGGVDLTVLPVGVYTFAWSNGATTEDLSNTSSGIYSVVVTDANGCSANIAAQIKDQLVLPQLYATTTAATCTQPNGSINVSPSGGAFPYSYKWSNAAITEDLANVMPGNYNLTVTDANGCSIDTMLTVANDIQVFDIVGNSTPDNNCILLNGAIDLSVMPAGIYSFLWTGGETTEDLLNLAAGSYTVQVTTAGNCTMSATFEVPNKQSNPIITPQIIAAQCGQSNGGIDLAVSGAETPLSFNWSNGQSAEDLINIRSGDYDVTVSSANGCTQIAHITVPENTLNFTLSAEVVPNSACSLLNGSIDLAIQSTNTGTFTYLWSNGSTEQDLSAMASGTYTVTVSAGASCVQTATLLIESVEALELMGMVGDIFCNGENTGSINLSVFGGVPPYSFTWSANLGTVEDPVNLSAGNYSVTVSDAQNCTETSAFNLSQPSNAVQILCIATNPASLPGANDGAAQLQFGGGVSPYTLLWNNGESANGLLAGELLVPDLAPGNYMITVIDSNGCTANCSFEVFSNACITSVGSIGTDQLSHCGSGCIAAGYNANGQVLAPGDLLQFMLYEGTANQIVHELIRSDQPVFCMDTQMMSYGVTYYIAALAGNNDGSGLVDLTHYCTQVSSSTPIVFYQQPLAGSIVSAPITCVMPEVSISGTSDLPNANFHWFTANGNILGNTNQTDILTDKAGDYTLIVSLNGCQDTAITQVIDLRNTPVAMITANPNNVLDCRTDEIVLTGTVKGTDHYKMLWMHGNGIQYPIGAELSAIDPGLYRFLIIDTLSFCIDTASILISENHLNPPISITSPDTLTCAVNSVVLNGSSSIPGIQFEWASINGQDTIAIGQGASLNVSQPSSYLLRAIDPVNGCQNELSVEVVSDTSTPIAEAGPQLNLSCSGQTAVLQGIATGGSGIFTYQWLTLDGKVLSGGNTIHPTIGEPGTYTLIVSDTTNGCFDSDEVVIGLNELMGIVSVDHPTCLNGTGSILIDTVLGAFPPIQYQILGASFYVQSENQFSNLVPGSYSILVTDGNGCSTNLEASIDSPQLLHIDLTPKVYLELGESYRVEALVDVASDEIARIDWSPSTGLSCDTCLITMIETPLKNENYQIEVVTKDGCHEVASLSLHVNNHVKVYIPNIFSPDDDGENDRLTVFADLKGVKEVKQFQIYSRWGELVFQRAHFQPNDPTLGWNGQHRGQAMNPGVFVYYAVVEFLDGREEEFKGDVTLFR